MEYVCREYSRKAGVSLSDGLRLLLEQAIGQRVNAVEEQAARLARIEMKLDDLLVIGAHVEGDAEAILRILDPDDEPDDMATLAEDGGTWDDERGKVEASPGYDDLLREYHEGMGWL